MINGLKFLYVVVALVAVGLCFYIRSMIKRFLKEIGINTEKKKVNIICMVPAVIVTAMCFNIFGVTAIILLHIIFLDMITRVIDCIIIKLSGGKYDSFKIWKKIYGFLVIPLSLTIILTVYGYYNMMNVTETHYTIHSDKVREEGYRVVLLSDVHFGISLDAGEMMEKCREISRNNPDIVVLCGDIVDEKTTYEQMQQVFEMLGKIKNKYGIYFVYGNHDRQLYTGSAAYSEEQLEETIEKNGIEILQDEVVVINDDITLAGREDNGYEVYNQGEKRASVAELLKEADIKSFKLVLDHQPKEYEENKLAGTDLLLSGHTHAGQIWPANILFEIVKFDDAVYGETVLGNMRAIVTSGFAGWGYPIKTSSPAEYVIIDIKRNHKARSNP